MWCDWIGCVAFQLNRVQQTVDELKFNNCKDAKEEIQKWFGIKKVQKDKRQ